MSGVESIKVGVSGRVLLRHVGGNTTYARRLYGTLGDLGVRANVLRPPAEGGRARSMKYAAFETLVMQPVARARSLDLVHYPADTGPIRRDRHMPAVVTIHGAAALHEEGIRSSRASKLWLARTRRAGLTADAVVTVSESSRDDIASLLGDSAPPIVVIPHGIDHEMFRPATEAEQEAAVARHQVVRPFVLYLGNIEPRKNLIEAVRAVELLNEQGQDLELLVGGKLAWDYDASVAAIDGSPHARRLGWLEDADVRALMSASEVFLFPSRYEGFGLPVLEALACGARVACTRRGSLVEVGGDVATYADGIDAEALAEAVSRALTRDRAECAAAGVARAAAFTWQASASAHLELFQRVIAA
jgi:glycosyltransferase involved in cell wall biosynthesis